MHVKGLFSEYDCFHATIQCLWLSENGFWDYMLSIDYDRPSNVFVVINVGAKNHNFNVSLILDKYNIMIVVQKLQFMQELTSAINVECLHSSLQAKLLLHNCAHAKHKKNVFL